MTGAGAFPCYDISLSRCPLPLLLLPLLLLLLIVLGCYCMHACILHVFLAMYAMHVHNEKVKGVI